MPTPNVKEELDKILDCFGGADGGVSFARLKGLLEELEHQSNNGNWPAREVLLMVQRFTRLIDVASGKLNGIHE